MTQTILDKIQSPQDVRALSPRELELLAAETREFLIQSLSITGGHLGSNLGALELTIALHHVFDTPVDRLVFDTGHQGYVHKILTGRRERMHTLRQHKGLSGFLKRNESEHDHFGAGHAGTAISAAHGMAVARDLAGRAHDVVAVVGDASLTAGMAFEALNHAGEGKHDLIVVVNDNRMSIAENVGALKRYFNKLIRMPIYNRLRHDVDELLAEVPPILGTRLLDVKNRVQEGVKNLILPATIFEELGFRYFGPVDGHDLKRLCSAFREIKQLRGQPRLVHVLTEKGHGYSPASEAKDKLHGVTPFDIKTGRGIAAKPAAPSYTNVFSDALIELARRDERIVAVTAAMPAGTGLDRFGKVFPDRLFDVGIAEQHAVTFAAGLACEGYKPVCAIYSTFLQRAFDQVLHDVAIQNLDVTFALDRAGLVGADGETHQGAFDIGYLRMIPGMTLAAPKDENELRRLLATTVAHNGPAALRFPRGNGLGVAMDEGIEPLPIGRAELVREGGDLLLIAVGHSVATALEAANLLMGRGISVAVLNARFIKPLDREMILHWADRTGRVVTLEEHVLATGFGSAVAELLSQEQRAGTPWLGIGLPDRFIEHGNQSELREQYRLTAPGVCERIVEWLGATGQRGPLTPPSAASA